MAGSRQTSPCKSNDTSNVGYIHMKWNEWGFRPPLCKYRLNWARRTTWGWSDEWDDATLQTHDTKFEAEQTTSWSRRLPTIFNLYEWAETFCFFETWRPERGTNPWSPTFQSGSFNHCTRTPSVLVMHWLDVRPTPHTVDKLLPLKRWNILYKTWGPKGFFNLKSS